MSLFPVINFIPMTFKGALFVRPVSLLSRGGIVTNTGLQALPSHQSFIVNVDIDWVNVYTGQAVSVILQNSQVGGPLLDHILMVYVDNTLNPANTTIIWADTQHSIDIPAFSAGYFPVFTSQYTCTVYNGTSGNLVSATQSQTTIQFCNFAVPPGTIQDGQTTSAFVNNQQQEASGACQIPANGTLPNIILPQPGTGLYYVLSSFDIATTGVGATAQTTIQIDLRSTSNQIYWESYIFLGVNQGWTYQLLGNKTNEQYVFPVNSAVIMNIHVAGTLNGFGVAVCNVSYRTVLQ